MKDGQKTEATNVYYFSKESNFKCEAYVTGQETPVVEEVNIKPICE